MKLPEALTLFLDEYDNENTRRVYHDCLKPLLKWLGEREANEVEGQDLVRYVQRLKTSGRADTTIQKHIKTIKTFFLWLERLNLISPPNPVRAVRQSRVVRKVRKDKAMRDDELSQVLDFLKWKPRDYAMVLFLATTGCRAGGVANLKIEDLDLERMRAIVTEKGDKSRPVMYDAATATALRKWLLQRQPTDHTFVFTWGSKALSSDAISQIVRRACIKVGVRSLGSHSLRHRIGHKFAEEGIAPTITQVYLGHSDVKTTLDSYYPDDWTHVEDTLRHLIQTPQGGESANQKIVDLHKKAAR